MRIAVYCSATATTPALVGMARDVGRLIGQRGHTLVSGGGRVGLMGPVAQACREVGGHTEGVITRWLRTVELADPDVGHMVEVDTLGQRIDEMEARADGFVVLPGGWGTLHEWVSAVAAGTLGTHRGPVVLMGGDHWREVIAWSERMIDGGFVPESTRELVVTAADAATAVAYCEQWPILRGRPGEVPRAPRPLPPLTTPYDRPAGPLRHGGLQADGPVGCHPAGTAMARGDGDARG